MSEGEGKLRLFLALPVPSEVKSALSVAQDELRHRLPSRAASWTRPENMHLTLRFLGSVDENRVDALVTNVTTATTGFGVLSLVAERLGAFPDLRYPRVVWAWVHDGDRLTELQRRVMAATDDFTQERAEERFTGHVTLARVKQIKRAQAEIIASFVKSAANRQFGAWTASQLELIRSELSADGSQYTRLATFPL
jgi:2'-5' RNA ligase